MCVCAEQIFVFNTFIANSVEKRKATKHNVNGTSIHLGIYPTLLQFATLLPLGHAQQHTT